MWRIRYREILGVLCCASYLATATKVSSTKGIPNITSTYCNNTYLKYYERLYFTEHAKLRLEDQGSVAIIQFNQRNLQVNLTAFGQKITIFAKGEKDLDDATVEIHEENGEIHITTVREMGMITYRGVASSQAENEILGTASGFVEENIFNCDIKLKNNTYYIEPASRYGMKTAWTNAIIYRMSDVTGNLTWGTCSKNAQAFSHTEGDTTNSKYRKRRQVQLLVEDILNYPNKPRTCDMELVADPTFYNLHGKNEQATIEVMRRHLLNASDIFVNTDFNFDGKPDNIGLKPAKFTIYKSTPDVYYKQKETLKDALIFLTYFAQQHHQSFCLSMVFSNMVFYAGRVGMSFIGRTEASDESPIIGGICHPPSLFEGMLLSTNLAIVTINSDGVHIAGPFFTAIIAHEIGHNFGSDHDNTSDQDCSPGGEAGNFLMFPVVEFPDKPNSLLFSPCSRAQIGPIIASKGSCLNNNTGPKCGNQITETGEECDCGHADLCDIVDKCCTPPGGLGTDKECTLRRSTGSVCSPLEGTCCTRNCKFSTDSCFRKPVEECHKQSRCDGKSAECPRGSPVEDGSPCMMGFRTCINGECKSDLCKDHGYKICICSSEDINDRCEVCCIVNNASNVSQCIPASKMNIFPKGGKKALRPIGSPCIENTHFCNGVGKCVPMDDDSLFKDDIPPSVESKMSERRIHWLITYWLYMFLAIVFVICIYGTVQGIQDTRVKHTKAVILMGHLQEAKVEVDRKCPEFMGGLINPRVYKVCCRLVALYPSVSVAELKNVANHFHKESDAVAYLSYKGYVIRDI